MKRNKLIVQLLAAVLFLSSCEKDFMTVNRVDAFIPSDQFYTNYNYAQQAVWNVYSYLPNGLSSLNYEAITDNAEATNVTDLSNVFNQGVWNQYVNPDDVWSKNFNAIRAANLYLENKDKADIEYIKNRIVTSDSTPYFNARNNVKFMEGEVLFLKAYFYLELIKRYGGVPVLREAFEYKSEDWKNVPRNTLDECVKYIVELCDAASAIIPQNLSSYSWYDVGRVTYGAIKTLKAKALLYAASPLFKGAGTTATWEDAAIACNDVIALNAYTLDANYNNVFGANALSSKEMIFFRQYGNNNSVEYANFPISFQGSNGNSVTPTQNLVDQFEVLIKDGSGAITGSRPFSWSNADDAANPYANRDPRLNNTVILNNTSFSGAVIETFDGGAAGFPKLNATKTGYYLKKWVNPSVNLVTNTSAVHTWAYFRYGQLLLDYAEAAFNAYGADGKPSGASLTALQALNLVRARSTMPALSSSQLNQASIEHERNVEMAYEDQRLWDVRRWKKGNTYFNQPVNRIKITKTGTGFTYQVNKLEDRRFDPKMDWYPIPQDEIVKTGWTQNSGW
ncbi:RagB/SusD family nutrient uptake outer membrane protein [Niabella yanshanensis]|uniref:RagB/SusD family nutrient uptake outer membrane protein n=1 Tax=Niabella yanshanensis TaxID=577386 RepID=A0ABZ0W8Q1_9BACT|nr:RagB/SusD family nutrient uptake outer membrane protein [Niabella yanshanensis]WQD38877.1 RagB/SusD family nutrient uptake outer membrane protein [Niabella yanshanensis]